MLKRCCKEDVCMLLLCMWWLVCGLCVCVSIWRPQRKTENGRQIKHLCTACICVGGFAWSHLNSRFYAFNSLRFTSKRQKETDTKVCIRTNAFVIKCIFSQCPVSKLVLTHAGGKHDLFEAHYSDVLQTSPRLNQISGWASLTSAAVCSLFAATIEFHGYSSARLQLALITSWNCKQSCWWEECENVLGDVSTIMGAQPGRGVSFSDLWHIL